MTYYVQLKKLVLDYVKHYQTDFTEHDKKLLRGYKGRLLMGIRTTGTNTFLLDCNHDETDFEVNKIWLLGSNNRFFYGEDGIVKEISKEECIWLFDGFADAYRVE